MQKNAMWKTEQCYKLQEKSEVLGYESYGFLKGCGSSDARCSGDHAVTMVQVGPAWVRQTVALYNSEFESLSKATEK